MMRTDPEAIRQELDRTPNKIINVDDRRHSWIGAWEIAPLIYDQLTPDDVGIRPLDGDLTRGERRSL